jgi:hypothetical protein
VGVVQHDQHPPRGQHRAVQRGTIIEVRRDLLARYPEGTQQPVQGVGGVHGLEVVGVTVQVEEQLPVGEPAGQPVRGVHGERGLADAGHPVDRADHHRGRGVPAVAGDGEEVAEFDHAAGEGGGVGR